MARPKVNSRRKGITAEQDSVRYFVTHGLNAYRVVATGVRNGDTVVLDRGDVAFPGFAVQVKNTARPLSGKRLADVWRETCAQASAAGGEPMLIEKRVGTANVGQWWLYLDNATYIRLVTGQWSWVAQHHLVRVEVGDVVNDIVLMSREYSS